MIIKGIITERHLKPFASFQIVREWEDQIANRLNIPIYKANKFYYKIFNKVNQLKLPWLYLFINKLFKANNYYLFFSMQAETSINMACANNVIPIIIDFWLKESQVEIFNKNYSNCKLILISSKEVFVFLKSHNCKLPIEHFPLSIPDNYISDDKINYKKTLDVLFAGRKDPIFWDYMDKYVKEFPDNEIEFVYKELEDTKTYTYISSKKGSLSTDYQSREAYAQLLQSAKITFYTTPGSDPAKVGANGFNQVTPRFLELIASGCLVMGRYPDNPDVEFYSLNKMCPKVNSYNDFKNTLKSFSDPQYTKKHIAQYYDYLQSHSTTQRANSLKVLLQNKSFTI